MAKGRRVICRGLKYFLLRKVLLPHGILVQTLPLNFSILQRNLLVNVLHLQLVLNNVDLIKPLLFK